jgi:hypothetical protein
MLNQNVCSFQEASSALRLKKCLKLKTKTATELSHGLYQGFSNCGSVPPVVGQPLFSSTRA